MFANKMPMFVNVLKAVLFLKQVKTSKHKYPNQVYKMPVQTGLFNHQVMAPPFKYTPPGHDQHNNIDDDARKNVEAVKTRYGKKEIGKIGA